MKTGTKKAMLSVSDFLTYEEMMRQGKHILSCTFYTTKSLQIPSSKVETTLRANLFLHCVSQYQLTLDPILDLISHSTSFKPSPSFHLNSANRMSFLPSVDFLSQVFLSFPKFFCSFLSFSFFFFPQFFFFLLKPWTIHLFHVMITLSSFR